MADEKLTSLTPISADKITGDDLLYIINDPAGSAASRKVEVSALAAHIVSSIDAATSAELASVDSRINSVGDAVSAQAVSAAAQIASALAANTLSVALAYASNVESARQALSVLHEHEVSEEVSSRQAFSQQVSVLSKQVSVISGKVSLMSGDISLLFSAEVAHSGKINTLSNQISAISAKNSAGTSSKGLQTAVNVLSNRISEMSQKISVASAAATSADSHANTASAAATSVAAVASLHISTVSAAAAVLSLTVSDHETRIQTLSASPGGGATTAYVLDQVSILSSKLSTISAKSATGSVKGLQTGINAMGDRMSIASAAIASAEVMRSTLSAAHVSTNAVLSAFLTGAYSVLSNRVSVVGTKTFMWVISAPAVGGLYGAQLEVTSKAVKVIAATISASTDIVVNIEKRPTFGAAGSNLLSADIDGSATPVSQAADTSAGAATITAGNWLYLDISGTSGSPAVGIVQLVVQQPG
jgi:hypothetical protein